jgi:flavorubredoxin
MAQAIGEGLAVEGVPYKIFDMAVSDRNDVIAELLLTRAVVVGSPTINSGLLPTLAPILEDLRLLRFKNKIGAAFGSYGWSGECVKLIEKHFEACKIPVVAEGVRAKWQPTADDLQKCQALGRAVAQAVLKE